MFSKTTLIAGAVGLTAGLLGAVIATRVAPRAERPAPAPSPAEASARVIVPPGWDPRIRDQVTALERRVAVAEGALLARPGQADPASAPAGKPQRASDARGPEWEKGRAEHYQKELETYRQRVASHESEPVDTAWAKPVAESIQARLVPEKGDRSFDLARVDCRSSTCVATLSFTSPAEALAFIAHRGPRLSAPGCNGYDVIPPPPSGEGRYDLPVVYTCR
jgi:hypothetical protein